jgi:hypothetical protein
MFEAGKIFSAIELRLNPTEEPHAELMSRLSEFSHAIRGQPAEFEGARAALVEQAQAIFKFEWNRVKLGE